MLKFAKLRSKTIKKFMARHKNSTLASFTYLIFFLPLLTGEKNDSFVKYHMKQAIGLVLTALVLQGAISFLGYWSYRLGGGSLQSTLVWPVRIFLIVEVVVGFMNAQRGEEKLLPWIGKHAARL